MDADNMTSAASTAAPVNPGQAEPSAKWSSTQAYGLATLCLALGLGLGFLLRGSASPASPAADAHAIQQNAPAAGTRTTVTPEQLKHMVDKTVEPFLEKLKQNPNDPKLLADVGNAYYAGHQFGTAVEYYTKSVDAKPDAKVLVQLANAQHYSGASDKAMASLNRALELDPKSANALFNLGMLKWQTQGDAAGALHEWQTLLKTNPNHPNRAQVEQLIKRVKQQVARN